MLLEIAIGDAYGAGFEFVDPEMVEFGNTVNDYVQHPFHRDLRFGHYTDDTQMSIAIAQLVLSGSSWTKLEIANEFVKCFQRDKRSGYAKRFQDFLRKHNNAQSFLRDIKPDSDKGGSAMRSVPCGLYKSLDKVLECAKAHAAVTHNTPAGIQSAQAVAVASHYFIHKLGTKEDFRSFVGKHVVGPWENDWSGKVQGKGLEVTCAAFTALSKAHSYFDVLKRSVEYTGDVDTVAAIAMGLASNCSEIKKEIPEKLYKHLEAGPYGRTFLERLDNELNAWFVQQ